MMDFSRTEEQELLIENLRDLFEAEGLNEKYFSECDEKHEFPVKMIKTLLESGYTMLGLPEEYGGTPCDNVTQMMIYEEISRLGGAAYAQLNMFIALKDVIEYGSEEQIRMVFDIAQGGVTPFSLAVTEPQAGSDTSAITTTVTRRDGKLFLNGQKVFISGADLFPYMLVVTRDLSNPKPHKAMSMWLIKADLPGISMRRIKKIGTKTISACEVVFEDVEIEESCLFGKENEGFLQLMKNFEFERLVQCSYSCGWSQGAFEDAVRYANDRVQFGQPIGEFQLIQKKITDMKLKTEMMRNMLYHTAWKMDQGLPVQIDSALTKIACDLVQEVVDDAMQVFGGIGYTNDLRIQRFWRDCRLQRIAGGTEEIMYYIAGRALLKAYR